jgi:uncharacterized repeat protein (TIGR03803 family)
MTFSIRDIRCASACVLFGALLGAWPMLASAAERHPAREGDIGFRVLHRFIGTDGAIPWSSLVQSVDGSLYGTTLAGGDHDGGTFYRIGADGDFSVLHEFGDAGDGASPYGSPVELSDDVFYGTASQKGAFDRGAVYKLVVGGAYTVLFSFSGDQFGSYPEAGLLKGRDGNLYGTTTFGGKYGFGTLFALTPDGQMRVLHDFGSESDVILPEAALLQASDGSLYGTGSGGGSAFRGAIFRLTSSGEYAILHSFTGADGEYPAAPLIQASDGNLYGTTQLGGAFGTGVAFRMTPEGDLTVLHDFRLDGVDGVYPRSGLLEAGDGYLYGTTEYGGPTDVCRGAGCGTVYRMTMTGAVTVIHDFNRRKGNSPLAGLTRSSHRSLIGATSDEASPRAGTVFGLGERTLP